MEQKELERLSDFAFRIREDCIRMTNRAHSGHLGSMLSIAEIVTVLYNGVLNVYKDAPDDPGRDRFILSKGHAAAAVYSALSQKGFFPREWLATYCLDNGKLMGHISHHVPGVEFSTGSLGHGLPVAAGMALDAKLKNKKHRVFCLMSDGDMNEGSTWEAIMFAGQHGLDRLVGLIDYNRVQALGHSGDIEDLEPLDRKLELWKWNVLSVDGHDMKAIRRTFDKVPENGRPTMIIFQTVKARGISRLEDTVESHYRFIPDGLVEEAVAECRTFCENTKKGE